jgi:DUF2933 family protein
MTASSVFFLLLVLACPLMMMLMMRGGHGHGGAGAGGRGAANRVDDAEPPSTDELRRLRDRLDEQIAERESEQREFEPASWGR